MAHIRGLLSRGEGDVIPIVVVVALKRNVVVCVGHVNVENFTLNKAKAYGGMNRIKTLATWGHTSNLLVLESLFGVALGFSFVQGNALGLDLTARDTTTAIPDLRLPRKLPHQDH
jgi:hypothetical protein